MPITQSLNSKGNVKKFTTSDVPFSPQLPVIAVYRAVSTLNQTSIANLGYSVDQASTDIFWLFVDGKKLELGASADYVFANIQPDNSSSQVTFNVPLAVGLNIEAFKLGFKKESEFGVDNRFLSIYEVQGSSFQGFVSQNTLMAPTATTGSPAAGFFYSSVSNRSSMVDLSQDLKPRIGVERIAIQQIYEIQNETGPAGQKVSGVVNDSFNQIRFVGVWTSSAASDGQYTTTVIANDFLEITFYGTGLNLLHEVNSGSRDFRASVDGGAETGNLYAVSTNVLTGRNYSTNQPLAIVSNLALGVHTVKIRSNNTLGPVVYGFEILNEATTLKVPPGVSYANGIKVITSALQSPSFNSAFEAGTLGTRGGRVVVYQKADGSIAKAVTPTNASTQTLASSDHSNEDVIRTFNFREFGASRSPGSPDDWSVGNMVGANRAFTLDDGTTTLIGNLVDSDVVGNQDVFLAHGAAGAYWTLTFVGTGLDVFVPSTTFGGQTYDFLIDGISIASAVTPYNTGWTKLVSGLPYGTHVVKMRQQGALAGGPRLSDFRVWGPKKPTVPVGSVELADYYLMANYVANATAGSDNTATGVLRKTATREFVYIGSGWTPNLGVGDLGGWEISTTTTTDSLKITFFGTGFEWRFTNTVVTVATLQINVDGSTNLSVANPPFWSSAPTTSFYGGVTSFTPSTGTVVCSTTQQVGSGVQVSGLNLGVHTVTITRSTGTNNFHNTGFDVITPVHSPKPNIVADYQNTALVGSCALNDTRKITPVKDVLPSQKAVAQAIGVTSNPTVVSSIYLPMPDMECTIKVSQAGFLELKFAGTVHSSSASGANGPTVKFYVDGVAIDPGMEPNSVGASVAFVIAHTALVAVGPGTHTVAVYWHNFSTGTATAFATRRVLDVKEV